MSPLRRVRSTLRSLFRKQKLDRDLDAELHSYEDLLTEQKVGEGMDPAQARRAARLEMGGIEQVKERVRERRVGAAVDALAQDIRFGFRSLRNNAGLTGVAVLILALGIGANTTLFSTVSAAILGGLPYEDSGRLVAGWKTRDGVESGPVSRVDYFDYREAASFEQLALIGSGGTQGTVTGGAETELIDMGYASWNLFPALGVNPILGRGFLPEEEEAGDARVIVISYRLWQDRYGGSSNALGTALHIDSIPFTIVGVLPARFEFLFDADVWGLIDRDGPWDWARDSHSHWVVGRLADGATLEQAQSELDAISSGLGELYPDTNAGKGLGIIGLQEFMVYGVRSSLLMLMGTTALVLLIACSNVAGLLLARGQQRTSEIAMRAALGASRGRLVRQLLTESVILTTIAGALGVWVAYLSLDMIGRVLPMGDLGVQPPAIDAGVLLFAVGVSIATGLAVGVVPALVGTSVQPSNQLRAGAQQTEGVRGMRLRGGLVVVQVAVSIVLLIGAGLLVRSLVQMASVDLGFDANNLLAAGVRFQADDYPESPQLVAVFDSLLEEVEALPGVTSASVINKLPILSPWQDWAIWPAEQERPLPGEQFMAMARWASPDYFETARIPLVSGRSIEDGDVIGTPWVVVVSESAARTLYLDEDPIGMMVGIGWYEQTFEIVGVVGDVRPNTVARGLEPVMYMASRQTGTTWQHLVARSDGDPSLLIGPIRDRLRAIDPTAVLIDPIAMSTVVDDSLAGFRVVMLSLGGFAAVALLLAAIGLYGVLAYNVSQRVHEIGIRLAMGAGRADVIGMVLRRGLAMVGFGLLLGVAGAIPVMMLLRQLLFETEALEPAIYVAAVTTLGLAAMFACLLPAWRATRVDVVEVLKRE